MNVSLDGNLYAAGSGKDISIGKLSDGQALVNRIYIYIVLNQERGTHVFVQRTLEGHLDDVTVVQFFPSNQGRDIGLWLISILIFVLLVLLSGASDFQVKIWSVLDGSNPVTLRGHTSASSRDGTVRLWHCGTGSTITVLGDYGTVVNKISVVPLPAKYASITVEGLDEKESETLDKMVLVGLNNGAIHGIHLGTKQELFSTPLKDAAITAIAYDNDTSTLCTGDSNGVVEIFSLSDLSKPVIQWKRNDHAVTGLGTRLNENGARVLCVSNADGSVYQTNSFDTVLSQSSVALEVEYTGNELEPVRNMVVLPSTEAVGFHRIACGIRGGNINIY
ncbi:WD40-repeat-containing domain protein [Phycomyces nitens]|nr:WD40-repeat-containing domain protein [Phycomyces nitens]